jgi:hypothetical protein
MNFLDFSFFIDYASFFSKFFSFKTDWPPFFRQRRPGPGTKIRICSEWLAGRGLRRSGHIFFVKKMIKII